MVLITILMCVFSFGTIFLVGCFNVRMHVYNFNGSNTAGLARTITTIFNVIYYDTIFLVGCFNVRMHVYDFKGSNTDGSFTCAG